MDARARCGARSPLVREARKPGTVFAEPVFTRNPRQAPRSRGPAQTTMGDAAVGEHDHSLDALLPPEMALRAERLGEQKVGRDVVATFLLAVLAGAFIAWGGVFSTTISVGSEALPWGVAKLLAGLSFCLGLVLVVVAGAELFTGNSLIVMAWASGRIPASRMLTNWLIVYVGNFCGAFGTAVLIAFTPLPSASGGSVGARMVAIAAAKCELPWWSAVAAGIGCNLLVCLAVWLCLSARSVADKVLAILFPITAFVATGMEHCVANMYFFPMGWWVQSATAESPLSWAAFLVNNLLPVTVGNMIGGGLLVGLVYWFIYLRPRRVSEGAA